MKLGKEINGVVSVVEVAESDMSNYLNQGYERVCETIKNSNEDVCSYERISNGWVEVWNAPAVDD